MVIPIGSVCELSASAADATARHSHSGRVREADRVEEGGGERKEGVAETPLERQREGKRGRGG